MGFGKWILGGVCAVGAVVAAPVVLPTAGLVAAVGSTGAAAATAVVAGAAGVAAGAAQEKKREEAYNRGKKEGYVDASEEFEEKCQKQEQIFKAKIKEYINKINELSEKLAEYKKKEKLTQEEIRERDQIIEEMQEYIGKLEEQLNGEDSGTIALASGYITGAKNLISAFR